MSHNHTHNIDKRVRLAFNITFSPPPTPTLTSTPTEFILGALAASKGNEINVNWLVSPKGSYEALESSDILKPLVGNL